MQRTSESESMKSSFLANMSHEIRTPLNAIVGFSNVIAGTDDADERKRFAETINHNTRLLLTLIDRVFDRFFKGDPFVPGTGLGLPICKKIIEKMGGRIGVVSDGEDRGSTFWFAIPFRGATA